MTSRWIAKSCKEFRSRVVRRKWKKGRKYRKWGVVHRYLTRMRICPTPRKIVRTPQNEYTIFSYHFNHLVAGCGRRGCQICGGVTLSPRVFCKKQNIYAPPHHQRVYICYSCASTSFAFAVISLMAYATEQTLEFMRVSGHENRRREPVVVVEVEIPSEVQGEASEWVSRICLHICKNKIFTVGIIAVEVDMEYEDYIRRKKNYKAIRYARHHRLAGRSRKGNAGSSRGKKSVWERLWVGLPSILLNLPSRLVEKLIEKLIEGVAKRTYNYLHKLPPLPLDVIFHLLPANLWFILLMVVGVVMFALLVRWITRRL